MLSWNVIVLMFKNSVLSFGTLRIATLLRATLLFAALGYNFALLCFTPLRFSFLDFARLRCDVTLLRFTLLYQSVVCYSFLSRTSFGYNFALLHNTIHFFALPLSSMPYFSVLM